MTSGQITGRAPQCPQCGATSDGYASTGQHAPRDGDVTICAYCGGLARFTMTPLGVLLRPLTRAERDELLADPDAAADLAHMQDIVARLQRAGLAHPGGPA